jgi:hypothetical protein
MVDGNGLYGKGKIHEFEARRNQLLKKIKREIEDDSAIQGL